MLTDQEIENMQESLQSLSSTLDNYRRSLEEINDDLGVEIIDKMLNDVEDLSDIVDKAKGFYPKGITPPTEDREICSFCGRQEVVPARCFKCGRV